MIHGPGFAWTMRQGYGQVMTLTDGTAAAVCGSPEAEAAWFPESKTLVVMNNAETAVRTRVTWPGGSTEMTLNPMETRITEG